MTIQMVNGFSVYAVTKFFWKFWRTGNELEVGGLDSYKNLYEYSKAATDVDVNKSQHFQDDRKFLEILEQLKA